MLRAGTPVAAAAIVAGLLGAAPVPPPAREPLPTVQRDIALTDYTGTTTPTPTFNDSLKFLLDWIGIGEKTPAQLVPTTATVGDLLGASGLSLTTPLTPTGLWDLLGLNDYTLGGILTDFGMNPASMTVDQALSHIQMAGLPLDFFLTPLGIPSTQTTLGLAHRFSIAHLTLDQMLQRFGFSGSETLGQALTQENLQGTYLPTLLGLGGLIGNMSCPTAVSSSMSFDQFINCLVYDNGGVNGSGNAQSAPASQHLTGSTTIEQILTTQHFYTTGASSNHTSEIIGNWTLGQILNFNSTTTLQQFVDNLHVNLGVTSDPVGGAPSQVSGTSGGPGAPNISEQDPTADNGGAGVPAGGSTSNLPTLGSENLGSVLTWLNLNPNDTLAQLLNEIMVGSQPLSSYTLQNALQGLLVDPLAIGPAPSLIQASTTLTDLLTGMGLGSETIDQMLNLT